MADKYQTLVNGRETMQEATVTSSGAGSAGEILALDSTGRIDVSVLPAGVGPDVSSVLASEALNSGDYVNIFNNAGTPNVRKADATNDRPAHGFVRESFTSGQDALIYFEGPNDDKSGLTPGARYYLGAAGGVVSTPPTSPSSVIHQYLGIAVNATTINTDIDDEIVL
jgi:hypothetical protein